MAEVILKTNRKKTDNHHYFSSKSYHPKHSTKAMLIREADRIRRNCFKNVLDYIKGD